MGTPLFLPQRVAIVGSREFANLQLVRDLVAALPEDTIVVSGGARGVDATAEEAAKARGLKVEIYLADWDHFGKRAGVFRNTTLVENSEFVFAFWDEISSGTRDMIRQSRDAGLSVDVMRASSQLPDIRAARRTP